MYYPCGKFGDCSFSRFGSIVRTNRHTNTQRQADERCTPASNNKFLKLRVTSNTSAGVKRLAASACVILSAVCRLSARQNQNG